MRSTSRVTSLVAGSAVLAASLCSAGFAGTDLFLPMVGRQAGVYPSNWYTTVWVHNPGAQAATARVSFLERGTANPSPPWVDVLVGPGDTEKLVNVVESLFHRQAYGALRVTCTTQKLVVTSRVFSKAAGEDDTDSMGQDFAGVPASFAIGLGERTQVLGVHQTVPADDSEFRFNFGAVETTGHTVTVRFTAFDENGAELGHSHIQVRELSQRQVAFRDHFPTVSEENARLEVEVISGSGRVIAYGSMIANASQDPTTFEMTYADTPLAGGLAAVQHDATLVGDGTAGSPLGLADEAVTAAKIADGAVQLEHIDTTGATSGQVLKVGSQAAWADDGLTLPFAGEAIGVAAPFTGTFKSLLAIREAGAGTSALWATGPCAGVLGTTSDDVPPGVSCAGVFGHSATRPGVVGSTDEPSAAGVTGGNNALGTTGALGTTAGVRGNAMTHAGVIGESYSYRGIWGLSTSDHGVFAETKDANHAAVIGENDGNSTWGCVACGVGGQPFGGYFGGNVAIDGDLSCTGCVSEGDLAAASISKSKLSASGTGSNGQVLGTDGLSLRWLPDGLAVPFTASGSPSPKAGVLDVTASGNGFAIVGVATSGFDRSFFSETTNLGVVGLAHNGIGTAGLSWDGIGVSGYSQNYYALQGLGGSAGVFGYSPVAGVLGTSPVGYGVHGVSTSGDGVFAEASAAGKSGLYAVNANAAGYAGFFAGRVGITTLSGAGNRAVYSDAGGVLTNSSSDARLKRDVVDLAEEIDVLEALARLRGVAFNWDTTIDRAHGLGDQREIGLIAQEVETVLPHLVGETADGYKSLDYAKLTAFLVEVTKAQQREIDALRAEVTAMRERLP